MLDSTSDGAKMSEITERFVGKGRQLKKVDHGWKPVNVASSVWTPDGGMTKKGLEITATSPNREEGYQ